MVKLEGYGVELQQLGADDIEQVRLWRNQPEISRNMEFREYISPEMQQRWFESMSLRGDLYLLVSCAGKKVGLVNLKDFDQNHNIAESGAFIAEEESQNSLVPYGAVLLMFDYGFDVLGLLRIQAHVFDDNERAIRFNKSLGFEPTTTVRGGSNRLYFLDKETYYKATLKIRKVLKLITPKQPQEEI